MGNIVIIEEKKIEKHGEENKKDTAKGKEKLIEDEDVDSKETEEEIDTYNSEEHEAQELETEENKRKIKEKQKKKVVVNKKRQNFQKRYGENQSKHKKKTIRKMKEECQLKNTLILLHPLT